MNRRTSPGDAAEGRKPDSRAKSENRPHADLYEDEVETAREDCRRLSTER